MRTYTSVVLRITGGPGTPPAARIGSWSTLLLALLPFTLAPTLKLRPDWDVGNCDADALTSTVYSPGIGSFFAVIGRLRMAGSGTLGLVTLALPLMISEYCVQFRDREYVFRRSMNGRSWISRL